MPSEKHIARNLRAYRQAAGMKQKELAARLFLSPQTVSKWEKGETLPDLSNLCRLSEILSVSVEALLRDTEKNREIAYIGIDGGGTKTDFALCSEQGEILRRVRREGCNPTACGMEKTLRVLDEGLSALGADEFDVRGVFAGIAGCPDETRRSAIISGLSRRFPGVPVDAHADIVNVIYTTDCRNNCVAAICGTGSVAFAKNDRGLFRIGGWGPLFDTAGSGLDIGRDAVRAALAEEDGFGRHTLLTDTVRAKLGDCVFDGMASIPLADYPKIASLAPLVFEAEKAGDTIAADILDENFARLAFLILRAVEMYDCREQVVLAGGVTSEEQTVRKYLARRLPPSLPLVFSRVPPVEGALAAAMELGEKQNR